MFEDFEPRHIPALGVACIMTFAGLCAFFDPHDTMLQAGLPESVASSPHAAAVMRVNNILPTTFGLSMYALYFTGQFSACDVILAVLGAHSGLVDSWVAWRAGNPRKAASRLVGSGLLFAAGVAGLTSGGGRR